MDSFERNTFGLSSAASSFGRSFGSAVLSGSQPGYAQGDISGLGAQLPNLFNKSPGAPLRDFENPGFRTEGQNKWAPPLHESEESNPRVIIPGLRIIPLAGDSAGGSALSPPSERGPLWTFNMRPSEKFRVSGRGASGLPNFGNSIYGGTSTLTQKPMEPNVSIMAAPTVGANPSQHNFLLCDLSRSYIDSSQEGYRYVTADMMVHGGNTLPYHDPEWQITKNLNALPGFRDFEGLRFAGVVRNAIAEDGTAPLHGDSNFGGVSGTRPGQGYTVAVTNRGPERMHDIVEGCGLDTGNYMYGVMKKFDEAAYKRPRGTTAEKKKTQFEFNLASREKELQYDPEGSRRVVELPMLKIKQADGTIKEVAPRPLQVAYFTSKTPPPRNVANYIDEWGMLHEGLLFVVGKVQMPPQSGVARRCTNLANLKPYMDNRPALKAPIFEILLSPDDGFLCNY